jgi:leucyl aminopeptidase
MRNWSWSSVETLVPTASDAYVVLGLEGVPSGELPGGTFAVLRHKVKASLEAQTSGDTKGPEWVEGDGKRALVQSVADKPGMDFPERLRLAAAEAVKAVSQRKATRIVLLADDVPANKISFLLEGWWLSSYRFDGYKSKPGTPALPLVIAIAQARLSEIGAILDETASTLDCTDWVRDAVNEPGSTLPPKALADRMARLSESAGLDWTQRGRAALEREGYQGLITVGKGSDHEPVLGIARYAPANAKTGIHLVLVGKGITFDTGGISIKPSDRMWEMKNDMAGSATVVGALAAIARTKLPIRVSAVVCLAENRPGNASVLPGDIFRAKNGTTVMVDNTDAEGRLVLTDGLWEAGELGATHIVDLATLTGAVVRALGSSIAGVLGDDESLTELIRVCGALVGEKFWPLPLDAEYRSKLDDPVADLKNSGGAEAGAITAALFLKEFVPAKTAWAHLDIAGTAFATKSWKYYPEGATAFGVRTLVELARRLSA